MARRRSYAPIERIRRFLLLGLVLVVAVVAALYLVGDRTGGDEPPPASRRVFGRDEGSEVVLAGQGFEYEEMEGDQRVFRLEAERILSNSEGLIVLRQVRVEIDREGKGSFQASSQEAEYSFDSSVASLRGDVRVGRGDDLELRAEGLVLVDNGRALESTSPVRFAMGTAYSGRADALYYDLRRNHLTLKGGVRLEAVSETGEVARLRCEEFVADRDAGLVRAEGRVRLDRGSSSMSARRLTLSFGADEQTLEHVQAFFDVEAVFTRGSGQDLASSVRIRGHQLTVTMTGGEPEKFEIEGAREAAANLSRFDGAGLEQHVEAPFLSGDFLGGEIAVVRAFEGVTITERLAFAPVTVRRACGQWGLASFDLSGELEEIVLQNQVDYQEQGVQALGDRLRTAGIGGSSQTQLSGDPALLRAESGSVEAPRIRYVSTAGAVEALDGVSVELPPRGGVSLVSDDKEAPIRLTSSTALWSEESSEFTFQGKVRAWQGEDYLLADRLVGSNGGDLLTATGNVKTVVRPKSRQAVEGEEGEGQPPKPVEVSAASMTYDRPQRLLEYSGFVRVHDLGRTMRCNDLAALLGENDRFERLTCSGQAILENPATGQTVRGEEAIYDPDGGTVRVSGAPAVMQNKDGAQLRGPLVIYDLEAGTAQVQSGAAAAGAKPESPPAPPAEEEGGS